MTFLYTRVLSELYHTVTFKIILTESNTLSTIEISTSGNMSHSGFPNGSIAGVLYGLFP